MINNIKSIFAILAIILLLGACKKTTNTTTTTAAYQQHNQDLSNIKSESDNVNIDVNNAAGNSTFAKNTSFQAVSICGGTVDNTGLTATPQYFVINYDGTTLCSNRIRSGSIKVALVTGTHWSTAGSQLLLTYTNYKVTFPSLNNHFITFNGTKLLTDVNGINYTTYLSSGSLTATIRERSYNMTVTFENNATSNWNCARLSTWTASNYSTFATTVNGDTTIGGKIIDSWGQTRYGTNFTTQMLQPWQSGTTCGWWQPTSGNYTSVTDSFTVSALLGVNSSGTQVTSGCAYGFTLNWALTPSNITGQAILPYW